MENPSVSATPPFVVTDAIADEIYAATPDDADVDVLALAEMIFECLHGPELKPAPPRSGASLAQAREWLDRFKRENPGVLPKPRIRVRAVTARAA